MTGLDLDLSHNLIEVSRFGLWSLPSLVLKLLSM